MKALVWCALAVAITIGSTAVVIDVNRQSQDLTEIDRNWNERFDHRSETIDAELVELREADRQLREAVRQLTSHPASAVNPSSPTEVWVPLAEKEISNEPTRRPEDVAPEDVPPAPPGLFGYYDVSEEDRKNASPYSVFDYFENGVVASLSLRAKDGAAPITPEAADVAHIIMDYFRGQSDIVRTMAEKGYQRGQYAVIDGNTPEFHAVTLGSGVVVGIPHDEYERVCKQYSEDQGFIIKEARSKFRKLGYRGYSFSSS